MAALRTFWEPAGEGLLLARLRPAERSAIRCYWGEIRPSTTRRVCVGASRRLAKVHLLLEHFEEMPHDTVVDVELILGERSTPQVSDPLPEGCPRAAVRHQVRRAAKVIPRQL